MLPGSHVRDEMQNPHAVTEFKTIAVGKYGGIGKGKQNGNSTSMFLKV
jgi:hypothetical protein